MQNLAGARVAIPFCSVTGKFSTTGRDWDGVVRDELQIFPIAVCGRGVEERSSAARAVIKVLQTRVKKIAH